LNADRSDDIPSDGPSKLDIFGLDRVPSSKKRAPVSIGAQVDHVVLDDELEELNDSLREPQIAIVVVLSDLTSETIKVGLGDREAIRVLLLVPDGADGSGTRAEPVRLLDSSGTYAFVVSFPGFVPWDFFVGPLFPRELQLWIDFVFLALGLRPAAS